MEIVSERGRYDIVGDGSIVQGTAFYLPFFFTDENDDPLDLTGVTVRAVGRRSADPSSEEIFNEELTVTVPTGLAEWIWDENDTEELPNIQGGFWFLRLEPTGASPSIYVVGNYDIGLR